MKKMLIMLLMTWSSVAMADGTFSVTKVEAQQRYPWNGLVDIVVTIQGSSDEIAKADCFFVASNCATRVAVPVVSVTKNGSDTGNGTTWVRRFIWNAAADVGAVKIDDVGLTVSAGVLDGVQLWENGPYWAECNVGATKPEEYGYYFWWGDTVGYKRNASNNGWISVKDGSSFSFSSGNCPTYGKDSPQLQSAGYVDSSGNLVAAHDAATAHLGAPWRMPTDEEFSALINNCTTSWVTTNGVYGRLVTGKGAYALKRIFLPAAGYGEDSRIILSSYGLYWSSMPYSRISGGACFLFFNSGTFYRDYYYRYDGQSVRPVRGSTRDGAIVMEVNEASTHVKLDCRVGVRECAANGEIFHFDANWYENCEEFRITDNGTVVTTGTAGSCTWYPVSDSSSLQHLLKLEVLSEGQVIATETARFSLGYIRNVMARQLWPHNKVALSFTVANDIGEVKRVTDELCVWCVRGRAWGIVTNVATRVMGDLSAKPGVHRIVWDMEADWLRFASAETAFGVSVERVEDYQGGVQLWEDGPYWAECNVGAAKPEEYGYYFWWGDTVGYKRNSDDNGWISVKDGTSFSFSSGNCPTLGKDNSVLQSAGYIDSKGNLMAAHDAATAHLGAPWRMPTDAEFAALINNCDTQWTMRGGVHGCLVTGRGSYASESIFLPAAGSGYDSYLANLGSRGYYWSSSPNSSDSYFAWYLDFFSGNFRQQFDVRYNGQPVRPLRGFTK